MESPHFALFKTFSGNLSQLVMRGSSEKFEVTFTSGCEANAFVQF